MSDETWISIDPQTLYALADGNPATATITVGNGGTTVDQYVLELDGLPRAWYSMPAKSNALFPEDKQQIQLVLHPAPAGSARAGSYPLTITARSVADPSQAHVATVTLRIRTVVALELELSPRKAIGRKGQYELTVHNNEGNVDLDVDFALSDPEDGCRYSVKPAVLRLPAGRQATVQVTVRVRRHRLVGPRAHFDIEVTARPSAGEPATIQGEFEHVPRLLSWKPVRRVALLAAVLAALGVPYKSNPVKQFICTNTAICTWLQMAARMLSHAEAPAIVVNKQGIPAAIHAPAGVTVTMTHGYTLVSISFRAWTSYV